MTETGGHIIACRYLLDSGVAATALRVYIATHKDIARQHLFLPKRPECAKPKRPERKPGEIAGWWQSYELRSCPYEVRRQVRRYSAIDGIQKLQELYRAVAAMTLAEHFSSLGIQSSKGGGGAMIWNVPHLLDEKGVCG